MLVRGILLGDLRLEGKIQTLLQSGATVTVVAPAATPITQTWARQDKILWTQRHFEARDLENMFLAVVATPYKIVNRQVFVLTRERGVLCNFATVCSVTFIIRRSCAEDRCRLQSRQPVIAELWLSAYAGTGSAIRSRMGELVTLARRSAILAL